MCRPACPRALISDSFFPQDKLFVDICSLFTQYSAEKFSFIHAYATELDQENRVVTVNEKEKVEFDALVIATGAKTPSPLMGFNKDAEFLREKWEEFRMGLKSAETIVIAGDGPVGIETAGELGEYLNGRGNKGKTPKVLITVVTAGEQILPLLSLGVARKAEGLLADVGVKIVKSMKVISVSPEGAGSEDVGSAAKVTLADGQILDADLYIPAMEMTYNTEFISKSLLTAEGRVNTNSSTLRVEIAGPRIYAVGDVSSTARPAIHNIFPAIPVLCANLKRDLLLASGKERTFTEDKRATQMVPIGTSKGVGMVMGWTVPSIMVWGLWEGCGLGSSGIRRVEMGVVIA